LKHLFCFFVFFFFFFAAAAAFLSDSHFLLLRLLNISYIEDVRLQWKRKTILTTSSVMPHLLNRIEVKSKSDVRSFFWQSTKFVLLLLLFRKLISLDWIDSVWSLARNDFGEDPIVEERASLRNRQENSRYPASWNPLDTYGFEWNSSSAAAFVRSYLWFTTLEVNAGPISIAQIFLSKENPVKDVNDEQKSRMKDVFKSYVMLLAEALVCLWRNSFFFFFFANLVCIFRYIEFVYSNNMFRFVKSRWSIQTKFQFKLHLSSPISSSSEMSARL
jgi:hypothetical protein